MTNVASAFDWVCGNATTFDCAQIPQQCRSDVFRSADYAFSMYYNETGQDPFANCYFEGSAILGNSRVYGSVNSNCIVSRNALFTALTDDGYRAVLSTHSAGQTAIFITRAVVSLLHGDIRDSASLAAFAAAPPRRLDQLLAALQEKDWVCGLQDHPPCPTTTTIAATSTDPAQLPPTTASPYWAHPTPPPGGQDSGIPIYIYILAGVALMILLGIATTAIAAVMNTKAKRRKKSQKAAKKDKRPDGSDSPLVEAPAERPDNQTGQQAHRLQPPPRPSAVLAPALPVPYSGIPSAPAVASARPPFGTGPASSAGPSPAFGAGPYRRP